MRYLRVIARNTPMLRSTGINRVKDIAEPYEISKVRSPEMYANRVILSVLSPDPPHIP
ncbi:unnamed protein product, partial [marine sediment metagenome]